MADTTTIKVITPTRNLNKWGKRLTIGALSAATISGTFYKDQGFPPIYAHKTQDGGGICLSLITKVDKGIDFHGIIVSPYVKIDGTLNGVNINLIDYSRGKINGLEIGIGDIPFDHREIEEGKRKHINGLDVGFFNTSTDMYGLKIGVVNVGEFGNYADLGVFTGNATKVNSKEDINNIGLLFNYYPRSREE